jgi:phosphoglycolate phosphatase-like HAD superfamily hydrolase
MIKCVVFDFDGVLVDSNVVKRETYVDIFVALGNIREIVTTAVSEEREGNRYQVIERILRRLTDAGIICGDENLLDAVELYAGQYNQICEAYTTTCKEISGASECLASLSRSYALYVNSATPEEPLRRVILKRGWGIRFKDVFGSPGTKVENLEKVMQREKAAKESVLFIGDSQRDLTAARFCGCHFIGIQNPDNDFVLRDFTTLTDLCDLNNVILEICKGNKKC